MVFLVYSLNVRANSIRPFINNLPLGRENNESLREKSHKSIQISQIYYSRDARPCVSTIKSLWKHICRICEVITKRFFSSLVFQKKVVNLHFFFKNCFNAEY